ncbi:MAG: hypothetical protein DRP45_05885 [Candidatus Zixiibacteriota bacterium]|nr:MAG: hypothetical protein DRP45_05885 [candidate division Zixibacteria bacterium]
MRIDLLLTAIPLDKVDFEEKTVVVIDVLRSSTSICAMLMAGARGVIPAAEPGEAAELWSSLGADAAVLAGERDGIKIENFQFGNSPSEFTPKTVGNKYVVLTTSNGTAPFRRAARASVVLSGGLVNVSNVAAAVANENRDVVIICSGSGGGFSIEDTLCGGMLLELLKNNHRCQLELNDSASLATLLYSHHGTKLCETISQGEHGRYLHSIGFGPDVLKASEADSMPVLPVLNDGRLIPADVI